MVERNNTDPLDVLYAQQNAHTGYRVSQDSRREPRVDLVNSAQELVAGIAERARAIGSPRTRLTPTPLQKKLIGLVVTSGVVLGSYAALSDSDAPQFPHLSALTQSDSAKGGVALHKAQIDAYDANLPSIFSQEGIENLKIAANRLDDGDAGSTVAQADKAIESLERIAFIIDANYLDNGTKFVLSVEDEKRFMDHVKDFSDSGYAHPDLKPFLDAGNPDLVFERLRALPEMLHSAKAAAAKATPNLGRSF